MNIRDRVHLALQDSLCLNSLAVLCRSHNELKHIGTYYRPAINNGVGPRFVLGCQPPDCYKGRAHAADEVPFLRKTVSLEQLRSALKPKRSDSVSVDRY